MFYLIYFKIKIKWVNKRVRVLLERMLVELVALEVHKDHFLNIYEKKIKSNLLLFDSTKTYSCEQCMQLVSDSI
jgi:hypothetical protein